MSKLEFYARPLVAFNPKNKDHRRWYHQFLEYRGWGHCPVRFICPDDSGSDLTLMIKNQLVEYYVQKEFVQNRKKTVDIIAKRSYNKTSPKKRTKAINKN
jgi:hypothetical protein